jgi:hypothetical protein
MKKLLVLLLVGFGVSVIIKGNHLTVTPDGQVHLAGWAVPLPESVRSSPVMGMVSMLTQGNLQVPMGVAPPAPVGAPTQMAGTPVRPAVAAPPPMPVINSVNGTFNANAPVGNAAGAAPARGNDQFNAAARAFRPQ